MSAFLACAVIVILSLIVAISLDSWDTRKVELEKERLRDPAADAEREQQTRDKMMAFIKDMASQGYVQVPAVATENLCVGSDPVYDGYGSRRVPYDRSSKTYRLAWVHRDVVPNFT